MWKQVILTLLVLIPLFLNLDVQPLYTWDESLFAMRAHHMAETGSYLFNFNQIEYLPEHPNTKPPLITWMQAFLIKHLGYTEIALRLPIVLIIAFALWLLPGFSRRHTGKPHWGYFSIIILVASSGFMQAHIARTGDHDGALAAFGLMSLLFFWDYLHARDRRREITFLLLGTFSLTAAVLTKHLVGLFFLPGIFLYLLYARRMGKLFKDPIFYACISLFAGVLLMVYIPLIQQQPGYLDRLLDHELFGRYSETIDQHEAGFFFYVKGWWNRGFWPWILLLPLPVLLLFQESFKRYHSITRYLLFCFVPALMVLSFSATKCYWYDAILFPILALLAGLSTFILYENLQKTLFEKWSFGKRTGSFYFLFLVFAIPMFQQIGKMENPKPVATDASFRGIMQKVEKQYPAIKNYTLATPKSFCSNPAFYRFAYMEKGYQIDIQKDLEFKPGQHVIVCRESHYQKITEKYLVKKMLSKAPCRFIQINPDLTHAD